MGSSSPSFPLATQTHSLLHNGRAWTQEEGSRGNRLRLRCLRLQGRRQGRRLLRGRPHEGLQHQPHPQDHRCHRRNHRKGQKILSKDEVFPMFKACKDSKDQGGFHDFVEIMKLYDKNNDNTIIENELFKLLTNLGEKLTKEDAKGLMKELCDPTDDDGFMPFIPFLERMCKAE